MRKLQRQAMMWIWKKDLSNFKEPWLSFGNGSKTSGCTMGIFKPRFHWSRGTFSGGRVNILAIDFETTGFLAGKDRITEMGAMLFTWDPTTIGKLYEFNSLVWEPGYPKQISEVIEITGITDEMLESEGRSFHSCMDDLWKGCLETRRTVDFIIAHNKSFDQKFFEAEMKHINNEYMKDYFNKPWICTLNDVEHPKKFKCKKLSHLALDYGVTVDPESLHRAIGDVNVMVSMVQAGKFDLNRVAERLNLKGLTVRAMVPSPYGAKGDGGVGKEKAKACGFNWDGKHWVKQIKEDELEALQKELGYGCAIIG